jgi:hypothetical protein
MIKRGDNTQVSFGRTMISLPPKPEISINQPNKLLCLLSFERVFRMSVLLLQMDQMMSMWDSVGGCDEIERDMQQIDTARAVLALFASGAGAYRTILQRVFEVIFRVIDNVCEEKSKHSSTTIMECVTNHSPQHGEDELQTDPYQVLRDQRSRMDSLVRDAAIQRDELLRRICALEEEKGHVEMLLSHQMSRGLRVADGDIKKVIKKAEAEKLADELSREIGSHRAEVAQKRLENTSLKELNAKYAAQALELSARQKILLDHNHSLGSSLSVLRHDLITAERDCDAALHELAETKRTNRLLNEALDSRGSTETRDTFVGRGAVGFVPRHLQCSESIKHVPMTKELAAHLVFEILSSRKQKGNPLSGFTAAFLTSRYGPDGVAYCYALDLACQMFDADVSLQMFRAAANGFVSDEIYTMIHLDVKSFTDACASADIQLHGSAKLCVPYVHAVGILAKMYPGYSTKCMEMLLDALDSALTNTGVLYYGTLFPDAARDELIGLGDDGKTAQESRFSMLFKEFILDDVMMTLNHVEERIVGVGSDVTTAEEVMNRVRVMDHVGPRIEIPLQHFFDTSVDPGSSIGVFRLCTSLRSTVILRSGLVSPDTIPHQAFIDRAAQDWESLTGEMKSLDYEALVSQSRRPEFFVGKRGTVDGILLR